MPLLAVLRTATLLAALFCLIGLIWLVAHTFAIGRKPIFNVARGDARRGVKYAFTQGMMPWEKESAGLHLPTFLGGIIYHAAIFLSFLYLFWIVLLPASRRPLLFCRVFLAAGVVAGTALLIKRGLTTHLRRLSCGDDFFANFLVNLFLIAALLHTFFPDLEPLVLAISILLFIYIPVGKIRHCFFFFYTRIVFGIFFGRRGVYPHQPAKE